MFLKNVIIRIQIDFFSFQFSVVVIFLFVSMQNVKVVSGRIRCGCKTQIIIIFKEKRERINNKYLLAYRNK